MSQSRPGPRILVAGIGSPHGEDQIGWIAVDSLKRVFDKRVSSEIDFIKLQTPVDLLEYTSDGLSDDLSGEPKIWVLVDACIAEDSDNPASVVYCWKWPELPCESFAKTSTHALGVVDTLTLAQASKSCPNRFGFMGYRWIKTNRPSTDAFSR